MAEIGKAFEEPTPVYGDNVQANKLCTEHFISPRKQYIATQYRINTEKVMSGDVRIIRLDSKHNIADLLTTLGTDECCTQLSATILARVWRRYRRPYPSNNEEVKHLQSGMNTHVDNSSLK